MSRFELRDATERLRDDRERLVIVLRSAVRNVFSSGRFVFVDVSLLLNVRTIGVVDVSECDSDFII